MGKDAMKKVLFIIFSLIYFDILILNNYLFVIRISGGKEVFLEGIAIWNVMWAAFGFILALQNPWK